MTHRRIEALNGVWGALGHHLNPPVREVCDPTDDSELLRFAHDEPPKADTLNPA